jgi:hypothetical protein
MTFVMFVDLGFAQSIVPLVGDKTGDSKTIAGYINAALYLRKKTFSFLLIPALILFPLLVYRHNWDWWLVAVFMITLIPVLFLSGWKSIYQSYFLIKKDLTNVYMSQFLGDFVRLILIVGLFFFGFLKSWVVAIIGAIGLALYGTLLRVKYNQLNQGSIDSFPKHEKTGDIVDYIRPLIPGMIFTALQSQIIIIIITIFGKSENIADIAALGKIGQLFVFLNAFNTYIVGPYFARMRGGVMQPYIITVSASISLTIILYVLGVEYPDLFLFLLGDKYMHLKEELSLMLLGASLQYIMTLMWIIQASRRWIWWWMPLVAIPGTILVQVCCVIFLEMDTTRNVLLLSVYTATFGITLRLFMTLMGFKFKEKVL